MRLAAIPATVANPIGVGDDVESTAVAIATHSTPAGGTGLSAATGIASATAGPRVSTIANAAATGESAGIANYCPG